MVRQATLGGPWLRGREVLPSVDPPNLIWVMPAKGAACHTVCLLRRRGLSRADASGASRRRHARDGACRGPQALAAEDIRDEVARGRMIVPANVHHALDP